MKLSRGWWKIKGGYSHGEQNSLFLQGVQVCSSQKEETADYYVSTIIIKPIINKLIVMQL